METHKIENHKISVSASFVIAAVIGGLVALTMIFLPNSMF